MKNTVKKIMLPFYVVMMSFSLGAIEAQQDGCFEPDHLLSYVLDLTSDWTDAVGVAIAEDQFLDLTLDPLATFTILEPNRLLVPATKFHNGRRIKPEHPDTHFVSSPAIFVSGVTPAVPPVLVDARFRYINQFDDFNLSTIVGVDTPDTDATIITPPIFSLLTPSSKCVCPEISAKEGIKQCGCPPFLEDHYLCYDIIAAPNECPEDDEFRLSDQFQRNRLSEIDAAVRVCNPVEKTFNGNTSDFEDDASNHLVCYSIDSDDLRTARLVNLFNQFSLDQQGIVRTSNELCVPSIKVPNPLPLTGF